MNLIFWKNKSFQFIEFDLYDYEKKRKKGQNNI